MLEVVLYPPSEKTRNLVQIIDVTCDNDDDDDDDRIRSPSYVQINCFVIQNPTTFSVAKTSFSNRLNEDFGQVPQFSRSISPTCLQCKTIAFLPTLE